MDPLAGHVTAAVARSYEEEIRIESAQWTLPVVRKHCPHTKMLHKRHSFYTVTYTYHILKAFLESKSICYYIPYPYLNRPPYRAARYLERRGTCAHPCGHARCAETGSQCDSPRHLRVGHDIIIKWNRRQGDMQDVPETGFIRLPETGFLRLPETGFLRLRQVLSLIPVGRTSWWKGVKSGRFPKPIKLSPRCTAWRAEDIRQLIKSLSDHEGPAPTS